MSRVASWVSTPWLGLVGLLTGLLSGPVLEAQTALNHPQYQRSVSSVASHATRRSAPVFIENRGQFDSRVRFQAKVAGKVLWLTNQGIVFDLLKSRSVLPVDGIADASRSPAYRSAHQVADEPAGRLVFAENFVGSNEHPAIDTNNARAGVFNYLIGNDPANSHTGVHEYGELLYRDVWPGIDVRIFANGSNVEQEFVVHPGGDPRKIKVGYDGIEKLKVDSDGSLAVQTAFGILRESKPRVYQQLPGKTAAVKGRFALSGDSTYTFAVDSYLPQYPLVIDPTVLLYSTYLGGSNEDQGWAIAADPAGNAYVGGYTASLNFPTTTGAYMTTLPGSSASFITKLGPTGIPVYSTFYNCGGCSRGMFIRSIAVDAAGEAYITGLGNGNAVIVAKLNAAGNALLYEISVGAGQPNAIALDASGNAYVAGGSSGGLTTTPNAYQPSNAGNGPNGNYSFGNDAFVAVVDPQGTLLYSTYIGGIEDDQATGIAVDAYGAIYVGGTTQGPYFPTTPGAFQTVFEMGNYPCNNLSHEVCTGGWVAKLNWNVAGAAGLIYSSYLGGSGGNDFVYGIAVDGSGSAYAAGVTQSFGFPVTPGAFNTTTSCGGGFVTKFNPGGSGLIYSTCVTQGSGSESLQAIALDALGEAYVSGGTNGASSTVVPVTPDAFQSVAKSANAFLVKLNAGGSGVIYGSYLGGSIGDVAHAVVVDPTGDVYLSGATNSPDFPVTSGAFQLTYGGGTCGSGPAGGCSDAFVTKFPFGGTFRVLSVVPSAGGNAGPLTATIFGSGFHGGVAVKLSGAGPDIVANTVNIGPDALYLTATFNLQGALTGIWNVVVTNPDGTTLTLPQAFTIQQRVSANAQVNSIRVQKIGTKAVPGRDVTYYVTVSNDGSNDSGSLQAAELVEPWFTYVYASPAPTTIVKGSALWPPAIVGTGAQYDQFIEWDIPNIPPGSSQALSYTVALDRSYPVGSPVSGDICESTGQRFGFCGALTAACIGGQAIECLPFIENPVAYAACLLALGLECKDTYDECMGAIQGACALYEVDTISSLDPNALVGTAGVGPQRWVSGLQPLPYVVSFANEASAQVPAQQVIVSNPLGPNVDMSTLSVTGINIPGVQVPIPPTFVPAGGSNEVTTNVDLRPAQNLLVNIDAKLSPNTGLVTLTFTSLDPTTNQPPIDPSVGFLPPGAGASLSFSVKPRQGIATGIQAADQAMVVFDANPPMSTPIWTNTIDNTPPVSKVSVLAATQTASCFRPQWTVSDVGSGVRGTTIFVSDTGGAYTPWLTNTTLASAIYNGLAGHTYAFYSQTTDLVGNVEATHANPDASTSVPAGASCNGRPTIAGSVANNSLSGTTETLTLQLTNNGNGNAQNININSVSLRTLVGTGSVTLSSPATPISVGSLAAGASVTETFTLNAPATVKEYSITEAGTVQDAAGNTYSFSIAEAVIP